MKKESKAGQRVRIARDAIAQIRAKRLLVEADTGYVWVQIDCEAATGLREALAGKNCTVCALGAAFVAAVDRYNVIDASDVADRSSDDYSRVRDWGVSGEATKRYLGRFFGVRQLMLMEQSFEGSTRDWYDVDDRALRTPDAVLYYARKYDDAAERAVAIFANVVRNKGTFVLPQAALAHGRKVARERGR